MRAFSARIFSVVTLKAASRSSLSNLSFVITLFLMNLEKFYYLIILKFHVCVAKKFIFVKKVGGHNHILAAIKV